MNRPQIILIGGGAAGFFAAIACAERNPAARVRMLERGKEVLQKVKVSGGGRCNVTHACFDPKELVKHYPRGGAALLGPFHRFGPAETVEWFESRGVRLKTEADGRMFPVSDRSQTIMDCLTHAAQNAGVEVLTGQNVTEILPPTEANPLWSIQTQGGEQIFASKLFVGSGSNARIWEMLAGMGHTVVPPVPSLFTFNIKDARIQGLEGLSVPLAKAKMLDNAEYGIRNTECLPVPLAKAKLSGNKLSAEGPLLITHWGMSGPAILKLSAWGARQLHDCDYRFSLEINWLGNRSLPETEEFLKAEKARSARKTVDSTNPFEAIPKRLWKNLVAAAGIAEDLRWADLNKEKSRNLAQQLSAGVFSVDGKSTYKQEFVTAGGIRLDEVNFKTFESKLLPGLFFAGEVLDIDAVTGGFNFQAAWTGGWIAGQAMAINSYD